MPALDIAGYIKQLDSLKFSKLECGVCGEETLVAGLKKEGMCQFCEAHVPSKPKNITDASARERGEINELLASGDWEEAAKHIDDFAGPKDDPLVVYAAGMFYWFYSDYKYHKQDHNLGGYMEENADNRYSSLYTTVKAKDNLYLSMRLIDDASKLGADEALLYTKFITDIRLKRPQYAIKTLEQLREVSKKGLVVDYAEMAYAVVTNDKAAEQKCTSLMEKHELNAFYYFSRVLVRRKMLNEALRILDKVTDMAYMPMAEELSKKIRITQEASAL